MTVMVAGCGEWQAGTRTRWSSNPKIQLGLMCTADRNL